jgi:hypothetical protein
VNDRPLSTHIRSAEPEPWFRGIVVDGLQRLFALRLEGAPAADALALTGSVWIDTLWDRQGWRIGDGYRDDERLRTAFRALAANADRWPTPAALVRHLPRPAELPPDLPAISPEQAARNRARIKDMLATLGRRTTATQEPQPCPHPTSQS